jgi:hypothetical protein
VFSEIWHLNLWQLIKMSFIVDIVGFVKIGLPLLVILTIGYGLFGRKR